MKRLKLREGIRTLHTAPHVPLVPQTPISKTEAVNLVAGVLVAIGLVLAGYGIGTWSLSGDVTRARDQRDAFEQAAKETSATCAMLSAECSSTAEERDKLRDSVVPSLTSEVESLTARVKAVEEDNAALKKRNAPAKAKSTAKASVKHTSGVEQWRSLVAKYFPASVVNEALYIIGKESGGDAACGSTSGCYGLFQIAIPVHAHHYPQVDALTPEGNVYIAHRLWVASGNSFVRHWYDHTTYPRYGG